MRAEPRMRYWQH